MEIIKTNFDSANKYDVYKLTKSSGMMVQDAPDGMSVPIDKWCMYDDPKRGKDGTIKENIVLSFTDLSGLKYSTVSATFQREFSDIVDIMKDDKFAVILKHGKTKAGKPFVTCELDTDYRVY